MHAVTSFLAVRTFKVDVLLTFASLLMRDGLSGIPVVALAAVVAVPAGGVVPALEADAPGGPPRQLVQLHVEPAAARVPVAVTFWGRKRELVRSFYIF